MTDELIGKTLGGYEILDKIGQGGMATVYRARQTSMNRIVALKILPRHLMRDDTYLERFQREVRIVAQLEHRSIVPVHDYGESEGQPYIAMRYLGGGTVDDLVQDGPIPLERVVEIVQQVAPALDYAHTKNVLHRDLKPSNVLLDDDGGAYITDFGIARIVGTEGQGTTITTQGVVGTPAYMSPEQAQGHELDGRSDVYSLGVMLFEMITGRRPFQNETPYGIAVMQVTAQPPNPRSIQPGIPAAVESVVLKALKKQPDNRYQTAGALADALADAVRNPDRLHDTQPKAPGAAPASRFVEPPTALSGSSGTPDSRFVEPPTALSGSSSGAPVARPPAPVPSRQMPPPSRQMPPPSQPSRPSQPSQWRVRRNERRRARGMWAGIALGGLIGCALLTVIVVGLGLAAARLLDDGDAVPAASPATGDAAIPTLDATSEAARQTMVGSVAIPGGEVTTTPRFVNATPIPSRTPLPTAALQTVAPVGVRPTPALPDNLDAGRIVYFDRRGDDFDIYQFDLSTGEEVVLVAGQGQDSYAAASPDGSRLVFQSDRDGDFDLYLLDLASGQVTLLTQNDVLDRVPAWSPDGAWIVYSSDTRGDGAYDIYRLALDGGEPELLISNGQRNSHPRYDADGLRLVFTSGEGDDANTWEIFTYDFASGATVQLTDNDSRDASPSFSPDGTAVLYNADGEGAAAVVQQPIAGGEPTTLYDGPGWEWGMHYSPDGGYILFNEEIDGESRIVLMQADGDRVQVLDGLTGFYPLWLP